MRQVALSLLMVGGLAASASADVALWDTFHAGGTLGAQIDSAGGLHAQASDDLWFPADLGPAFRVERVRFHMLTTDPGASLSDLTLSFFQSFPFDSDTMRAPKTDRAQGPADAAFAQFSLAAGEMSASLVDAGAHAVGYTVRPLDGAAAAQVAGVTGTLWEVTLSLGTSLELAPAAGAGPDELNHYFLSISADVDAGEAFWVSGANPPLVFPGDGDREGWVRSAASSPDWISVADIVRWHSHSIDPDANLSFQVFGSVVPAPGSLALLGLAASAALRRRR